MKKIFTILMGLLMVLSTIAGGLAIGVEVEQSGILLEDSIKRDSQYNSVGDMDKPSFFDNLAFTFVTTETEEVADGQFSGVTYQLASNNGPYTVTSLDILRGSMAGKECNVGEYILPFRLEKTSDGGWKWTEDLFDLIYEKLDSDDGVYFGRFWTESLGTGWDYGYDCRKRIGPRPTSEKPFIEYRCTSGYVRSGDDIGNEFVCQSNECKTPIWETDRIETISDVAEVLCKPVEGQTSGAGDLLDDIGTVTTSLGDVSIELSLPRIDNKDNLVVGQVYTVIGNAFVKGTCNDCVIETDNGNVLPAFNIVERSEKGACGDDLTTGIKFDASNEWVTFYLGVKATEAGTWKQEVKAYTGCGGELLDTNFEVITVSEKEEGLVTCYTCDYGSGAIMAIERTNCGKDYLFETREEVIDCKVTVEGTPPKESTQPEDYTKKTVSCYYCDLEETLNGNFEGTSCPEGTSSDPELDCTEPPLPPCGNTLSAVSCQSGEGEGNSGTNPVVVCEGDECRVIDGDTTGKLSGVTVLSIVGIVGMISAVGITLRKKKRR